MKKQLFSLHIPARKGYRISGTTLAVAVSLLAVYLIWGSTYLGIRFALRSFPPLMLTGIRFFIAGVILYLFLRGRGVASPSRSQWFKSGIVAALLMGVGTGGVSVAEQYVSSGIAALVISTVPLWTALFAGIWGRWPRFIEWGGIVLGFVGVGILSFEVGIHTNPAGILILLLSAISWAGGSVWSRHLSLPSGLMGSAAEMLIGGALLLLASIVLGERIVFPITPSSLSALAFLIVFGSLIVYSTYMYLLSHVHPTLATSYAYVNPVVAVGLGAWLLGEHVTPNELLALVIILFSVGFLAWGQQKANKDKI